MQNIDYAKMELNKYYFLMTGEKEHNINLRVDEELKSLFKSSHNLSIFDDAYQVNINQSQGDIIGINVRSVLLAVYELFTNLGCRFIKPKTVNEYINKIKPDEFTARFTTIPANRHRTICIEGSTSLENALDMVEWAPKVGFNGYFIQFRTAHEFFERWYTRQRNNYVEGQNYSVDDSIANTKRIIAAIKKRNLIYHAVGHGWTTECLKIPSVGWKTINLNEITPDKQEHLALINGKREFFKGVPLNTQLCYSNKLAQNLIVDEIVNYAIKHPEIDILHFWLADFYNNFCECENCKKELPSEYYVEMLNAIDEKLTRKSNQTKIVFLIYFELLWAPVKNKIKNPDRFIMMFAPITRTYTRPYLKGNQILEKEKFLIPKFNLNKNIYPSNVEDNLSFLFAWQKCFTGDSFLFDYHLMWDEFKDLQGQTLAQVLYQDLKSLPRLGLNGYVSCQLQRNFFPTGFPMYLMGKTLVNPEIDLEELRNDYFQHSFGSNYQVVLNMLTEHTELFSFAYMRSEVDMIDLAISEKFKKASLSCQYYDIIINDDLYQQAKVEKNYLSRNFYILTYYTKYTKDLADILADKASGVKVEELKIRFEKINKYMLENEDKIQEVFDGFYFNLIIGDLIQANW